MCGPGDSKATRDIRHGATARPASRIAFARPVSGLRWSLFGYSAARRHVRGQAGRMGRTGGLSSASRPLFRAFGDPGARSDSRLGLGMGRGSGQARVGFNAAFGPGRGRRSARYKASFEVRVTAPLDGVVAWRRGRRGDGPVHRDEGPAIVVEPGVWWDYGGQRYKGPCRAWLRDGRLHRTDGPAYISAEGRAFYLAGERLSDDDWEQRTGKSSRSGRRHGEGGTDAVGGAS